MSTKLITQLNPFSTEHNIQEIENSSIAEIIAKLDKGRAVNTGWRVLLNDEIITDYQRQTNDGDTLYVKLIPEGDASSKDIGAAEKWAGGLMTVAGAVLVFTGVGSFWGAALLGAGIGIFLGGVALYNMDLSLKDTQTPEQSPSIRGSKNQARPLGTIPILLGKRRVYSDVAANSYTWVDENGDQYLYQLFCSGQKDQVIDTTSIKIGETAIELYSESGSVDKVLDGTDGLISLYISQGKDTPPLMNKCVHEDMKNTVLVHETEEGIDGSIITTTPADTEEINVDIFFYNGLGKYDDDGTLENTSVEVEAMYKKESDDDSHYQLLGYFNSGSNVISGKELKTKRLAITKSGLEKGKYTVKVSRKTADSSSSKTIDTVYLGSIRSISNQQPVSSIRCRELTLVGLKIKASSKLNSYVEQLNFVSQSINKTYDNVSNKWEPHTTSNPASAALYVMQGELSQQKLTDSEIDWNALEKLYDWCALHEYECNEYIYDSISVSEILNSIASTCRAEIFRQNGKITVIQDILRDGFVQVFTPRNSWNYKETILKADIPDALSMQFPDAESGYAQQELKVYNTPDGNYVSEPDTVQDVSLWGVTSNVQARKLGMYKYAVTKNRPFIHNFSCDFEYMLCSKGDWIKYAGDIALAGITQGRISGILKNSDGKVRGFYSDELIPAMEEEKNYAVRIRRSDGTAVLVDLKKKYSDSMLLEFEEAMTLDITEDCLFTFGLKGEDSIDLIITNIQCNDDMTAEITAVSYSPEIFDVDDPNFVLPDFINRISSVPSVGDSGEIANAEIQTFITYHDGFSKPDRPLGDGSSNGWHLIKTPYSRWQSTKNEKTINLGQWSDPEELITRGRGLLKIYTEPETYQTSIGDVSVFFRIKLDTFSNTDEILVGDIIEYDIYHYEIVLRDSTYAYLGAATSIQGAPGKNGDTYTASISLTKPSAGGVINLNLYKNGELHKPTCYVTLQSSVAGAAWSNSTAITSITNGAVSYTLTGNYQNGIAYRAFIYSDSDKTKLLCSATTSYGATGAPGSNSVSYEIDCPMVFKKGETVTFNFFKVEKGVRTAASVYHNVEYTTDGSSWTTFSGSKTTGSSFTTTALSTSIKLRCRIYSSSTATVALDDEYSSRVTDGSNGTSATNVYLGNENITLACDKDGKLKEAFSTTVTVGSYSGTTRVASTITKSSATSNITVGTITNGTTSANGSVVLSMTKGTAATAGNVVLSITANSVVFSKTINISIAKDGQTGSQGDPGAISQAQIIRATNEESVIVSSTLGTWEKRGWRSGSSGTASKNTFAVTDCPNPAISYGWHLENTSSTTSSASHICQNAVPLLNGTQYIMSCYARKNTGSEIALNMQWYTDASHNGSKTFNISNEWEFYSFAITPNVDNPNIYFGCKNGTTKDWVEFCGMKVELGDTATPWCEYIPDQKLDSYTASVTMTEYTSGSCTINIYKNGALCTETVTIDVSYFNSKTNAWVVSTHSGTSVSTGTYSFNYNTDGISAYRVTVKSSKGDILCDVETHVGKTGSTGASGATWYQGTAITGYNTTGTVFSSSGISSAKVGDQYLNSSTFDIYKCTLAGNASTAKWAYVGNITSDENTNLLRWNNYSNVSYTAGKLYGVYEDGEGPFGPQKVLKCYRTKELTSQYANVSFIWAKTPIDASQKYRFSFFIKQPVTATGCTNFLGIGEQRKTTYVSSLGSSTGNSNAYLSSGAVYGGTSNRWYLIVAHVHPYGSTRTAADDDSGVYDVETGVKVGSCTDFKWMATPPSIYWRQMFLYCGDTTGREAETWACNPRIDICNGLQPSVDDLLHNNTHTTEWYGGTAITGTSTTGTAFSDSGITYAVKGDKYINTSTDNVYTCTRSGDASYALWAYSTNIKGSKGDTGNNTKNITLYYVGGDTAPAKPTARITSTASATTTTWTQGKYTTFAVGKKYYTCTQVETYNSSNTYQSCTWTNVVEDVEYKNAGLAKFTADGKYLGLKETSTPTGYSSTSNFDWFLANYTASATTTADAIVKGNVYVWNGSKWVKETNSAHLNVCMGDMMDLIDEHTEDNTDVNSVATLFAQTLATKTAFIDNLLANDIVVGNKIKSTKITGIDDVENKGFYFDKDGNARINNLKTNNGEFNGIIRVGNQNKIENKFITGTYITDGELNSKNLYLSNQMSIYKTLDFYKDKLTLYAPINQSVFSYTYGQNLGEYTLFQMIEYTIFPVEKNPDVFMPLSGFITYAIRNGSSMTSYNVDLYGVGYWDSECTIMNFVGKYNISGGNYTLYSLKLRSNGKLYVNNTLVDQINNIYAVSLVTRR